LKRSPSWFDEFSPSEILASGRGVFRHKPLKSKSRLPSIVEQAAASNIDTRHRRDRRDGNAVSVQLQDSAAASSGTKNGGAALEFDAVQDAVRKERLRISRDLHDHAGQYLVGVALRLAALEMTVADPSISSAFADLRQLLDRFCDELRAISAGERRGIPYGCHLTTALSELTAKWESETGIAIRFCSVRTGGIEPDDATTEVIYRIAEEALTNIAKHAINASHVTVRLEFAPVQVKLTIEDDGPGLNSLRKDEDGRPVRRGGITNMHERLAERGGQLVICSPPTGGTSLVATIPI
jgi:signal transduction histidine kinase